MKRRIFLMSAAAWCVAGAAEASTASTRWVQLSQRDARNGIRQALEQAAQLATQRLGVRDGFFGDPQVRIPLPRNIARLQSNLRSVGLSGPIDDLELSLNRSAEAAMPEARRIFVDTIRNISVQDAVSIIRGGDSAATDYLRGRSETSLTRLLRPRMESALEASGAYRLVSEIEPRLGGGGGFLGRLFGSSGASGSLRESVTDHAVSRALDGVFHYVAVEERAIRRDPVNRTTDILRRVFGR